jgi:hypothetical protein
MYWVWIDEKFVSQELPGLITEYWIANTTSILLETIGGGEKKKWWNTSSRDWAMVAGLKMRACLPFGWTHHARLAGH